MKAITENVKCEDIEIIIFNEDLIFNQDIKVKKLKLYSYNYFISMIDSLLKQAMAYSRCIYILVFRRFPLKKSTNVCKIKKSFLHK